MERGTEFKNIRVITTFSIKTSAPEGTKCLNEAVVTDSWLPRHSPATQKRAITSLSSLLKTTQMIFFDTY